MAIEDPTAPPETAAAAEEYMQEAETAWAAENHDHALTLYRAVLISGMLPDDRSSLGAHRAALILMGRGDNDEAYRWLHFSKEPGAADLLRAIDGGTVDTPVDPSESPSTVEEVHRYLKAAESAHANGDHATFEALVTRLVESPVVVPGEKGAWGKTLAQVLLGRGEGDRARQWAEASLPFTGDPAVIAELHQIIASAGADLADDEGTDNTALRAGIDAFETGDAAAAQTQLESVRASAEASDADKGRAAYYLGALAYTADRFTDARALFHEAQAQGPEPERSWAADGLTWRYQEG